MVRRKSVAIVLSAVCAIALTGCPGTFPPPPFNTTAAYLGTWKGKSNEDDPQHVKKCPLGIVLTQDPAADYPGDHLVQGTVTVDYSCIEFPEWIETPPPSVVEVGGVLQDNGNLSLITGGCTTALCVVLTLNGVGVDNDGDGLMDSYSGSWAYTILLAGVEPFGFTGKFEVEVDSAG